jgi:hypothetical protein
MTSIAPPTKIVSKGFGRVFAVMGAILLAAGGGFAVASVGQSFNTTSVAGTVIDLEPPQPNQEGSLPVAEYEDAGRRYLAKGRVQFSPPAFSCGDVVSVLYRRDDPSVGYIDSFTDRWFIPSFFGSIGTVFLVIGIRLRRMHSIRDRCTSNAGTT